MSLGPPLSMAQELKAGDRVFMRFNASFLGESISKKLADFVSRYNTEKALRVFDWELEGNPVYDPIAGTVNMIVRVHGTLPAGIVIGIVAIGVAAFLFLTLREARLIFSATAGGIADIGQGFKAVGEGLGFGLALAGVVAAAFVLGWLDLRG